MMLMWRRFFHPSPDLSSLLLAADRAIIFPGITAFERVQRWDWWTYCIRRATGNKPTNERYEGKHWPGEPHMDTQRRAGRTPAGKRPGKLAISFRAEHGAPWKHKTFTLRMLRRWWEASQPSKSSQKKKKNPMCKDLLLYTGFWLFSLTDLETNTTNSQPLPWGFFFFFSFPLLFFWKPFPQQV